MTETTTDVGIGTSAGSELGVGRLLDVERIYLEPTVRSYVDDLLELIERRTPWLGVRYAS